MNGFTLIEVMVVVAIVSLVAGSGAYAIGGTLRAQETRGLARGILFAMLRARGSAVADGFQRRLRCVASECAVEVAAATGMAAQAAWSGDGAPARGGTQGLVWAVDHATDVGALAPAGPLAQTETITFFPDGSATPATLFVRDVGGAQHFKVYVFAATGMPRLVATW